MGAAVQPRLLKRLDIWSRAEEGDPCIPCQLDGARPKEVVMFPLRCCAICKNAYKISNKVGSRVSAIAKLLSIEAGSPQR